MLVDKLKYCSTPVAAWKFQWTVYNAVYLAAEKSKKLCPSQCVIGMSVYEYLIYLFFFFSYLSLLSMCLLLSSKNKADIRTHSGHADPQNNFLSLKSFGSIF
jgi:hypothetical protein